MSNLEHVIYIQGLGRRPAIQSDLPELWLPYGLEVERQSIDWGANNYTERLSQIGGRILELSSRNEGGVSIVAASGGVKTMMSLFARYYHHLNRGVAINGKAEPFVLTEEPNFWARFPNIAASSDTMVEDYENMNLKTRNAILQKILWLYSLDDEIIPSDNRPKGINAHALRWRGHILPIEETLKTGGKSIAQYLIDGVDPVTLYDPSDSIVETR